MVSLQMRIFGKDISNVAKKRREWVNEEFGKALSGHHLSNKQKSKTLKSLWKEAKKRFK